MHDVLEHVSDSAGLLRLACSKLTNHGLLLLSVPNVGHWSIVQGLLEGRWDYADQGILDRTHLRFFTLSSLMQTLDEAGLKVIKRRSTKLVDKQPSAIVTEAFQKYADSNKSAVAEFDCYQFQLICQKV